MSLTATTLPYQRDTCSTAIAAVLVPVWESVLTCQAADSEGTGTLSEPRIQAVAATA